MNRKIHCLWCESVNSFKFQTCDYTSPSRQNLKVFTLVRPTWASSASSGSVNGHYRLGQNELQGYLILFDPHAQTHDRLSRTVGLLSRLIVPSGSSHITASQKVQTNVSGHFGNTNGTRSRGRTQGINEPRLETRVQNTQ